MKSTDQISKDELGRRVKAAREALDWSQSDLAEKTTLGNGKALTDGAIKMIETGKRWPRPQTLKAILKALNISLQDLMDPRSEQTSQPTSTPSASEIADAVAVRLKQGRVLTEEETEILELFADLTPKQRLFYTDQIRRAIILSKSKDISEITRKGK